MLVARRPISIGSVSFKTGDRITREAQNQLPPGRMPQLIEHGWIEELVDEIALDRRVDRLEKALDDLRTQVAKLVGNKTRPRRTKAQDEEETPEEADEGEAEAPAEAAPPEEVPEEAPEAPAEAEPEPETPAEPEPTPEEPEPEAPADEPVELPQPEPEPEPEAEAPVANKVWDPIDACWKSEDELVAATEARTRARRRSPAKTKARG